MRLAVGADHAGFAHKSQLLGWLKSRAGGGHRVIDFGAVSEESVDYPDFAARVARAVARGEAHRGILLCGTGIGMAMAANKIRGIRAAVCWNEKVAALASEHNGANVLCLPARFASLPRIRAMIGAFLRTPFGGGRHARRTKKIMALEKC